MVLGLKTNETRSWDTNYRGPLAIHATAGMPKWCCDLLQEEPFKTELAGIELPKGCIVGTVEVIGTVDAKTWAFEACKKIGFQRDPNWKKTLQEICYGDYSENRFAWQTKNPVLFETPIPAKGKQGFWNYEIPPLNQPTNQ